MGCRQRLPAWFRTRYIDNSKSRQIDSLTHRYHLHSVCQSARCPNRSECWSQGTATFMIMGEQCTRACRFCAVKTSARPPPLDKSEPKNLAKAVSALKLKYIVITSVARDDLEDGGAGHFAECVREIKKRDPHLMVETLIPDFRAHRPSIKELVDSGPDVISHNMETVERLTPSIRDLRAGYRQSLEVLRIAHGLGKGRIITKSGMMVGLGERPDEVRKTMKDVLDTGAVIFTIGQYLRPEQTPRYAPIKEFITPGQFREYERVGYELGFRYMACGPLVRSSYKAGEPFIKKLIKTGV